MKINIIREVKTEPLFLHLTVFYSKYINQMVEQI